MGGIRPEIKQMILDSTGFTEGVLPFRYLGISLSSRRLTIQQCYPLIEKIVARIKHWSARMLSYAGRCQLIKSVLFAISDFWLQVIPLPNAVIHHIEAICRSFLWSGAEHITRKAPIAWEKVCQPKVAGGLNVTNLQQWNRATLGKLLWNIHRKADRLWIKWLDTYYFKGKNMLEWQPTNSSSWILKKIFKTRDYVCGTEHWRQALEKGKYHNGMMYKEICGDVEQVVWKKIMFDNHARPKSCFTLWMAIKQRLPTKYRLGKYGIMVNLTCCFCDKVEDIQHLFFGCNVTNSIWQDILVWMKITHIPLEWDKEMEWIVRVTKQKGAQKQILKIALAETIHEIWHERNEVVFNKKPLDPHIIDRIKHSVKIRCSSYRKLNILISKYN